MPPELESIYLDPSAYDRELFFAKRSTYAILIPVLNEGIRIQQQLHRMQPYFSRYDTYIVDGGSSDGALSSTQLQNLGLAGWFIKKGPGKLSRQLQIGFAHLLQRGYDGIILIDGNNKDDPAAIATFVAALSQGFDHVQGSRFLKGGGYYHNPRLRIVGIRCVHAPLLSLAARSRITDSTNGFRAYSKRLLLDPRVQPFREIFSTYELPYYLAICAGRMGFKTCEVPVIRAYPANQTPPSKIRGWRGNTDVLLTLLRVCAGLYKVKEVKAEP